MRLKYSDDKPISRGHRRTTCYSRQRPKNEERISLRQEGDDQVQYPEGDNTVREDRCSRIEVGDSAPEQESSGEGDCVGGDDP